MSDFYTNVYSRGKYIYVRGVENGKPYNKKIEYYPTLYATTNKQTKYKTIYGKHVDAINPGTMFECSDWMKQYQGVSGFEIYGMTNWVRQFIADTYPGTIIPDMEKISIESIDIETTTEHGMTVQEMLKNPIEEITLITMMNSITKKIVTFGVKPWSEECTDYHACVNEKHLLRLFLSYWQVNCPNIVTGWNIEGFDIPYLVSRISRVLGDDYVKSLSPFDNVREKEIYINDTDQITTYIIAGVSIIDYLQAYKKFTYVTQERYTLDHIASVELGENKRKNPGKSFREFYTLYWDTFVDYNRQDAILVDKLEDKLKLIELMVTIAYMAKVNIEDVFSPVNTWDNIIYNYLRDQNIVIPMKKDDVESGSYVGAYVKDPLVGFHEWILSFDLNSLYPHLIMQYNLSPETIVDNRFDVSVDMLLNKRLSSDIRTHLNTHNLAMAANGCCFRKDIKGFLPTLMESYYADRSKYKKEMLKYEQEYQHNKTKDLEKTISRLNNLQMALKILLNSCYGALANTWFRYFDLRLAEAITMSGQLSLRWVSDGIDQSLNRMLKTDNYPYVIYNDTDSVYITIKPLIDSLYSDKSTDQIIAFMDKFGDQVMQPVINGLYDELYVYMNAYQQKMIMKREVLVDRGIFVAKKKYILNVYNSEGVQYAEPKLKVMGLEMVRSTTPQVIRAALKDSIKVILTGDNDKLISFIQEYKDRYMQYSIDEIARPSGINGIKKYASSTIYKKRTPAHVRASLMHNHMLKKCDIIDIPAITDMDKIKMVYLRMPNPTHENVIAFVDTLPEEFNISKYVDYDTQFDKTFLAAIKNIVEPLGWSLDNTQTIEEFF